MNTVGLYIHVPFCAAKCPYCDFYSMPASDDAMDAYTAAVLGCMDSIAADGALTADTLYLGGGTPSLLGGKRLARILTRAQERFGLNAAEITVECNPGGEHVPGGLSALFHTLRAAGANRLSMGLQSAEPAELAALGRRHTPQDAAHAVELARAAGFQSISLDLMLGVPKQTPESAERSVRFCAALGVEHISAYLLKIEPNTPFARSGIAARCPDDDAQADLYLRTVQALAAAGYLQYEISNFAKQGQESRHNLKYWLCEDYIGIGPAAHSLTQGTRWYYPRDVRTFVESWRGVRREADDAPALLHEVLCGEGANKASFAEYAMLRLRLARGLHRTAALARYPEEAAEISAIFQRAKPLAQAGLVTLAGAQRPVTGEAGGASASILASPTTGGAGGANVIGAGYSDAGIAENDGAGKTARTGGLGSASTQSGSGDEALALTPRGFLLSNAVTLRLLELEF